MHRAASSGPVKVESFPIYEPMGVLLAATMNTSRFVPSFLDMQEEIKLNLSLMYGLLLIASYVAKRANGVRDQKLS